MKYITTLKDMFLGSVNSVFSLVRTIPPKR